MVVRRLLRDRLERPGDALDLAVQRPGVLPVVGRRRGLRDRAVPLELPDGNGVPHGHGELPDVGHWVAQGVVCSLKVRRLLFIPVLCGQHHI